MDYFYFTFLKLFIDKKDFTCTTSSTRTLYTYSNIVQNFVDAQMSLDVLNTQYFTILLP